MLMREGMLAESIAEGVFMVGGPDITAPEDAAVYLIDCGGEHVMIDCGAGKSIRTIVEAIQETGYDPRNISTLILTHCHVDHIGAVEYMRDTYSCTVVAHDYDATAIESGDPVLTAAHWYRTKLPKTTVDLRLKGEHEVLMCGKQKINCLHTPGHTPGSIVVYIDRAGRRILFGQDIHGPFHDDFRSDIVKWRGSMEKLLSLDADILCEGHFGIYSPKEQVERYIQGYLDRYAHY
jgi:glyoxylase-like metal-dependent hydrolase (beta-lactamase superfamily II)